MTRWPAIIEKHREDPPLRESTYDALLAYIRLPECKRLISRLRSLQAAGEFKSVALLSQERGEGKSLLIAALALGYMILLDKSVLIMDMVSQPGDEPYYYRGLAGSSALVRQENESHRGIDLLMPRQTGMANGFDDFPPRRDAADDGFPAISDPAMECSDFRLGEFVASLSGSYDLILMDTCAMSEVDADSFDPMIVAQFSDASLLVQPPEGIERATMNEFMKELKRHRITPLGVVSEPEIVGI